MPFADPAAWREARIQWEVTPEMTLTDVAQRLDVAIPTVSIRARRETWVKADVIDPERLNYTPRQLVEVAVRALVRAASQTKDVGAAVKAAGMLLDRAMGRVVVEQTTPLLTPTLPEPQEPFPDGMTPEQWLNRFSQAQPEPEPTLPPTQAPRSRLLRPLRPLHGPGRHIVPRPRRPPQPPQPAPPQPLLPASTTPQACQRSALTAIQRA